jgi:uncharacterized protein (TIGR02246 family)
VRAFARGALAAAAVFLASSSIVPAAAQIEPPSPAPIPAVSGPGTPADVNAIHALVVAYQDAWNKKDADGLGALFAEDADFSSIYGQNLHGRAIIAEKHKVLFAGPQKESQQTRAKSAVKMRFLKPDVASVDSISEIVGVIRPDGSKTSSSRALTNFILVKNQAKWEIAVFHNMLLPNIPTGPPTGPAATPAPGLGGE